jgi:hypothetical protein
MIPLTVAYGEGVPLHPGAARYYRERGYLMNTAQAAKQRSLGWVRYTDLGLTNGHSKMRRAVTRWPTVWPRNIY